MHGSSCFLMNYCSLLSHSSLLSDILTNWLYMWATSVLITLLKVSKAEDTETANKSVKQDGICAPMYLLIESDCLLDVMNNMFRLNVAFSISEFYQDG